MVALALFSTIVVWRVRAERLADLDASLESRAAALAALVERDWDTWEMDTESESARAVVASLTGVTVVSSGGTTILSDGALSGRTWTGVFTVESDGPGKGPPEITVTVGAPTTGIDGDLRTLAGILGVVGATLAGASVFAGLAVSRGIVGAEEHQRLQAQLDQQTRFTADASHELRTPLSLVRSEAELALRRERTPEEYRVALGGVVESATRMQSILESLLLLARADAGVPPERVPIDLLELARETAPGGVTVEGSPAPILGDARLLAILVRNLTSNAVRHAPGGKVTVSVTAEGPMMVLRVTDDGEGIPADALPHVLERFYRVDAARSRDQGGSGLGLSIVATVARLHRGTVTIDSKPAVGTVVTVRIPAEDTYASR